VEVEELFLSWASYLTQLLNYGDCRHAKPRKAAPEDVSLELDFAESGHRRRIYCSLVEVARDFLEPQSTENCMIEIL
jgi:hypothetical protein